MSVDQRAVGILIFPDVEVLDFAGPYEVFSRTRLEPGLDSRRSVDTAPFMVFTVAHHPGRLRATGGLQIIPDYDFSTAPPIDILVVPGGFGTRPLLADASTLDWIRNSPTRAEITTSVCTGALLLAQAGLLSGKRATTHWGGYEVLGALDKSVTVVRGARVVEDRIVTSAGVSAGIDMAFAIVERLHGKEVADETARYIEYARSFQM